MASGPEPSRWVRGRPASSGLAHWPGTSPCRRVLTDRPRHRHAALTASADTPAPATVTTPTPVQVWEQGTRFSCVLRVVKSSCKKSQNYRTEWGKHRTPPGRGVCKRPKQEAHVAGGGPATATPLPPMSSRAGGSVGNHLPVTSRNPDDSEGLEGPLEAEASRNRGSVTVTCRNQDSRSVLPRGRPGCGPLLWATGSCRASAGSSP